MNPRCRFCGKDYRFPECELEARMFVRPGAPAGDWAKAPGKDDQEKFENWTVAEFAKMLEGGKEPGELGVAMILLGRKEGLLALQPMLTGLQQQKWDFIVKRMFPFSFSLTHSRPGGYETDRLKRWIDQNFGRLQWNADKKAYVLAPA